MPPPHPQVKALEAENQRKSRELGQLQARGSQDAQQSQQEGLELQRQVAEAQAAREAAQEEVGGPRGPGGAGREPGLPGPWETAEAQGLPGLALARMHCGSVCCPTSQPVRPG